MSISMRPEPGMASQVSATLVAVALGPVAMTSMAGVDPHRAVWVGAAVGIIATGLLHAWLWHRWFRPITKTVGVVRRYTSGQVDSRAAEGEGGPESRWVASAINRLIERTEEMRHELPADERRAMGQLVDAIHAFARDDFTQANLRLDGPYEAVVCAWASAREAFRARTDALYRSAQAVASNAGAVVPQVRALAAAADAQRTALNRLAQDGEDAARRVDEVRPRIDTAIAELDSAGAEQRRFAQRVHEQLLQASKCANEAYDTAERARGLLSESTGFEQALGVLVAQARAGAQDDSPDAGPKALGAARASQANLRRELEGLCRDLDGLNEALGVLARTRPPPLADLRAQAAEPLTELGEVTVRGLEMATCGARMSARAGDRMADCIAAAADALKRLALEGPRLATSVAQVGIDGSFESTLLERLNDTRDALNVLKPGELSPAGVAMFNEIKQAAEAANGRLSSLVRAIDAASSALRIG